MKIVEAQDIKDKFELLSKAIEANDVSLDYLQMVGGALNLAIHTRIEQLQGGYAQSSDKPFELERLKKAKSALTFKINTGSIESITADILKAYTRMKQGTGFIRWTFQTHL